MDINLCTWQLHFYNVYVNFSLLTLFVMMLMRILAGSAIVYTVPVNAMKRYHTSNFSLSFKVSYLTLFYETHYMGQINIPFGHAHIPKHTLMTLSLICENVNHDRQLSGDCLWQQLTLMYTLISYGNFLFFLPLACLEFISKFWFCKRKSSLLRE